MGISLIAAVAKTPAGKLVIAKNGNLLAKLKQDMSFFKNLTTNGSKSHMNIVLMGRKTFNSIPERFSPLKNRINFVLTQDPILLKLSKVHLKNLEFDDLLPYYMTFDTFCKLHKKLDHDVFVIGGGVIYNKFLDSKLDKDLVPTKLYITEISGIKFNKDDKLTYMDNFDYRWKLIGYSEKFEESNVTYRILRYGVSPPTDDGKYKPTDEFKYLELANKILTTGNTRADRTGTGTVSLFGEQLRFDLSNGILPLLTTKKVNLNMIIHELLWMMTGNTDAKVLQKNGVKIWDGNTSREFLDKRGLQHYPEGVLGAGYGWQIRFQGAKYHPRFADTSKIDCTKIGGFDQLIYIEELLKNDPFSRRILMSYWNPIDFKDTALLPCHYSFQFYVEEINGVKYLSGLLTQRSADGFLGAPFNFVFYSTLIHIMCLRHNFKPKELVFSGGDVHIYKNHIEAVKKQLLRTPLPFPKLKLNTSLKNKDWSEMTVEDFELIGYFSKPFIKAPMAI
jgi:thymidylate synthase